MNYYEFIKFITNNDLSPKEIYDTLTKKYGFVVINDLYEQYISDDNIEDDKKIEIVNFYIDVQNKLSHSKKRDDVYSEDAFVQYLNTLTLIDYLGKDEVDGLFKRYYDLNKLIDEKKLDDDKVYASLKKLGFNNKGFDKIKNFKNGLDYLKSLEPNDEVNEVIDNINLLNEQFKIYSILVEQNLRLVVSCTKMFFIRRLGHQYESMNVMDAIQEGNVGLSSAINKYDPYKGVQFSTHAFYWIRQAISRAMDDKASLIRKPVHFSTKSRLIERTRQKYFDEKGCYPTVKELSEMLNLTESQIEAILKSKEPIASLDKEIEEDGDTTLGDMIEDKHNFEDIILNNDDKEDIKKMFSISKLSSKFKLVIILRFGLDLPTYMSKEEFIFALNKTYTPKEIEKLYNYLSRNMSCLTLDAVGKFLNLTRERIRQIESKSMKKLLAAYQMLEKRNIINQTDTNIRTFDYYTRMYKTKRLTKDEITILIDKAREILDTIYENGITKAGIKKSALISGYEKEFNFTSYDLENVLNYLKSENKNSNLRIKLGYYIEYVKIIETLIEGFNLLKVDIMRGVVERRGLFEYETKDVSGSISRIDSALMGTIDKFLKTDRYDLEDFISPYIAKKFKEEVVAKRKIKKP